MSLPTGRKSGSVSISEPAREERISPAAAADVPASAAAPIHVSAPSSAGKLPPAEAEKQLLGSIPAADLSTVSGWKVKQVVITRLDSGPAASSVPGMNVAPGAGPPMLSKLKRMGTSKMHKFAPAVTLEQAIKWLSEYGNADSSILFENNCCFIFEHGKFLEFEDLRDDDDE